MQYIAISGGQTFPNRLQFPYEQSEEMETTIRNIRKTLGKKYKIGGKSTRKQAQKNESMDVSLFQERGKSMKSVMSKQKGKRRKNKKRLRKDFFLEVNDMSTEEIPDFETLNDSEYEDESSDEISHYESFSESEYNHVENTEEMYETLDEITDEIFFGKEYDFEEKTDGMCSEYEYYEYLDEQLYGESECNEYESTYGTFRDSEYDDYDTMLDMPFFDWSSDYEYDHYESTCGTNSDLEYDDYGYDYMGELIDERCYDS